MDTLYAMATGGGAGGAGGLGSLGAFLPFILIFVVFYFLLIQPQRRKDQEHRKMLDALKKGDRVVTNGGIYGRIINIKERKVTLEIAKGVEIDVLRSAIGNRIRQE